MPGRKTVACLFVLLLATPAAAMAQALTIDAAHVGGPGSNEAGEIFIPKSNGPFPAMVILHGCDGIGRHYREWGQRLADWGYVALLIDSFRPRGVFEVCNDGNRVPASLQAQDGFAGAAYLRTQHFVQGDRIGLIGFSHGGWAVLKAVLAGLGTPPFAAAIAFYPGCETPQTPLVTDTLILMGDADDWTPVGRCVRWRAAARTEGHALEMIVYPGALHGFDSPYPPHPYAGHYVGGNDKARAAALLAARAFLDQRLLR